MSRAGARRILLVGDYQRAANGAHYYNMNFVLQAGFIRAGHHVLTFSDRDVARERSVFGHKTLGQAAMNRALVAAAVTYRPQLILAGHVDMCSGETFAALRDAVPGVRIAQFNVDSLLRRVTMQRFRSRSAFVDRSFITTADPTAIAALGCQKGTVAFFPNPVEPGLAIADLSMRPRSEIDHDGIFLGNGEERRRAQVEDLVAALPGDVRFHAAGGIFDTSRLKGPLFLETLVTGAMSPSLPLDDRLAVDRLYASDRIAQLLGNGLVAFCRRDAGLDAIYEDGIVPYTTIAELAQRMAELARDDAGRRAIAARGRRIGFARTGSERVARYMLDMTLGDGPTEEYGWPCALI